MRSRDVSTPVVSRSKKIIGRLSFKFIAIVLGIFYELGDKPNPQEIYFLSAGIKYLAEIIR